MNTILFMGSRNQFPDCLLRMVEAEVDACSAVRLSTPTDLAAAIANGTQSQLIVIEDSLWDQMHEVDLPDFSAEGQPTLAIAFRHERRIAQGLVARAGLPKGISFLPMDLNIESWLGIVRLLLTGCPYVPSELQFAPEVTAVAAPRKVAPSGSGPADSVLQKLTPRERDVLALVAEGMQNKIIAGQLQLSEHTVKLHLHHVISKLGARNRTEAALKYRRSEVA